MTSKKGTAGLASSDLALMRMLLQQQQIPQIQVGPVNDIGSGLASAGQQVLNAMITRQNMSRQNAMMQQMLEQAQAAQAAEQAQAQAAMEATYNGLVHMGVSPDAARIAATSGDASVLNNVLTEAEKIQSLITAADGLVQQWTVAQVDKDGLPVVDADGNMITRQLINQQEAMAALRLPGESQQRALSSLVYRAEAQRQGIDINTPEGQNAFKIRFGFDPKNAASFTKENADANIAALDAAGKAVALPFIAPQAQATLESTIANTDNTNLGAEQKSIENSYLKQYLQARNEGQGINNAGQVITNTQNAFNLGNQQQAQQLLNSAAQAGTTGSPVSNVNNAMIYSGLTGQGNPFQLGNDMTQKLVNPKVGQSPVEGMTSIGQQMLPPPQAAQPQQAVPPRELSPVEQGQLLQMDFQGALKAPGRWLNSAGTGIINGTDYLQGLFKGFTGQ